MFGLVTLKAIQTTYSQIFRYLWVPIVLVLGADMVALYFKIPFMQSQIPRKLINKFQFAVICDMSFWLLIILALRILFLIFVYLTVRSSVLLKIGIIINHIGTWLIFIPLVNDDIFCSHFDRVLVLGVFDMFYHLHYTFFSRFTLHPT